MQNMITVAAAKLFRRSLLRLLLVQLTCLISALSGFPSDVLEPRYQWSEPGDINIGAILSIHSSKTLFDCTSYIKDVHNVQNVEAFSFAVGEINDNPHILPNIKLGFDILDDCMSPSIALSRAIQFMPSDGRHNESFCKNCIASDNTMFYNVVGVIGTYTSKLSIIVASVLNIFHLPQISNTATSDILSDKTRFPYFFRMVPPDRYQAIVISKLLRYFDWNHVSIVYSDGTYGREGVKTLKSVLKSDKYSICIDEIKEISYGSSQENVQAMLKDLDSQSDTKIVIAFIEIEDALLLSKAIRDIRLSDRFIWIGSDSVSIFLEDNQNSCQYFEGSIVVQVQPHVETLERFKKYLDNLLSHKPNVHSRNPWLSILRNYSSKSNKFMNTSDNHTVVYQSFKNESGNKFRTGLFESCLIDSVYTFALALHTVMMKKCTVDNLIEMESIADCIKRIGIYEELEKITFNGFSGATGFDKNGNVNSTFEIRQCSNFGNEREKLNKIGIWDVKNDELEISYANLSWQNGDIPKSSCLKPCTETLGTIFYFPKKGCCWQCIKCKVNEIVSENTTRCLPCQELFWPDTTTRTSCHRITPFHFGLQHAVSIGLCTCAVTGIIVCIWIYIILIKYRNEHVIRCTSLEMMSMILFGTLITYALTISFLSTPNSIKCYFNHISYSLTFTVIYSPLLVKTNRIYRIFNSGRRTTRKPCFISNSSQVIISLSLVFIQVAIVILSTNIEPPEVITKMPSRTKRFVEMYCRLPHSGLLASLSYNLIIVIICTFYAFKTRKLPNNYKETRFIAHCVVTTLLIWTTFVPTYLTSSLASAKVTILGVSLVLNASVIVTCLFIPRLYSLYKSLKHTYSNNKQHNGDFRIVKHVVQRKRSLDPHEARVDQRNRFRTVASAVTIMSDICTPDYSDVIVAVAKDNAKSSALSESSESDQPQKDI